MSQAEFYLYHEGQQIGPWTLDQVLAKLKKQEVNWADYVYSDVYKEWLPLMEAPHFAIKYKEIEQELSPARQAQSTPTEERIEAEAWFVLRGNDRFGPYSALELAALISEGTVMEYDYIWNKNLEGWKKVCDVDQFGGSQLGASKPTHPTSPGLLRRRHARAKYEASILIHNQKAVFKGASMEISPGGASIILFSEAFKVGDECFLHFKAGEGVPTFNCHCRIANVISAGEGKYRFGVQFTSISQTIQKAIKTYTTRVAA